MNIGNEYLKVVKARFKSIKELGDKTMLQLAEEEMHWSLNETSNSIAIIVKHLSGNMISRWTDFLTTDGEKPDRNRDQEFIDNLSKKETLLNWEEGWNVLFAALNELTKGDLLKNIYIRGESHSVIDAIERQMAHYAYHVGQIVYIGKQLKNQEWKALSISIGQSEEYLQQMLKENRKPYKFDVE